MTSRFKVGELVVCTKGVSQSVAKIQWDSVTKNCPDGMPICGRVYKVVAVAPNAPAIVVEGKRRTVFHDSCFKPYRRTTGFGMSVLRSILIHPELPVPRTGTY